MWKKQKHQVSRHSCSLRQRDYDGSRKNIKVQRHHTDNIDTFCQGYGFCLQDMAIRARSSAKLSKEKFKSLNCEVENC